MRSMKQTVAKRNYLDNMEKSANEQKIEMKLLFRINLALSEKSTWF